MDKKKILFIQPTFDVEIPRNIRTANILEILKKDFDVTVLCFISEGVKHRDIDGVKVLRLPYNTVSKYFFNKTYSGYRPSGLLLFFSRIINVIGTWIFGFPDPWVWEQKRLYNLITEYFDKIDIVVFSMIPFSTGELVSQIKKNNKWQNTKVVFDIGDPLAYNAIHTKVSAKKEAYERKLLKHADKIIVTNSATKSHYDKVYNFQKEKIEIIPQGVDTNAIKIVGQKKTKNRLPNFIYAGAFYPKLRSPIPFLKAIRKLRNLKVNLYSNLSQFGTFNDITSLSIKERVSQEVLFERYAEADVLLYFDNAYGMQTSGKIYELLAFKKYILFIFDNEDSPVFKEVKMYENIIFCKNNEEDVLLGVDKVIEASQSNVDVEYDVEMFSWETRAKAYKKFLLEI